MSGARSFESRARALLDERYHHRHPFNLRMHEGALTPEEIRGWVRSRYCYQTRIPLKDAAIVDKSTDPAFRRDWSARIDDHRGRGPDEGGLRLWLALAEAVGLDAEEVASLRGIAPGVRAACDDYVRFVESHDLLESVASSLTELYAGELMQVRLRAFRSHYPWVAGEGLRYFERRTVQAPRDAAQALHFVAQYARGEDDLRRGLAALERKCDILWRLLDAVEALFRRPRVPDHAVIRCDERDGRTLVVLPERAVALNDSGREIVGLCDGSRSAEAIAAELRRRHPRAGEVEVGAHEFLAEMERLGVLEAPR